MTRPGRRTLTEDDLLVWRRVARSARPLPGRRVPDAPPPARGETAHKPADQDAARPSVMPPPRPAKADKKPGPPAEMSGEKRIRRGKLEVEATLDLHGMTLTGARAALGRFLTQARLTGMRIVLVVTGKGRAGEGALRRALPDWLAEEAAHVSGYAPAHQRHGGTGAVYVRLRKPPAKS